MSEFKGTKEEWLIKDINKYNSWIGLETKTGKRIVEVKCFKRTNCPTREEAEANAKLIACAPEMLEALKEMISFAEFHGYTSSTEINNARIIIKKATE